jgi:small ligand-binding sensory domain FIST
MGTLSDRSTADRATRLMTAITVAVGVLAVVGGIAECAGNPAGVSLVEGILTIIVGLACGGVGLRVKYGAARRWELLVISVALVVLVVADAWLSSSWTHLFGLAIPAAVLLLTAGVPSTRD